MKDKLTLKQKLFCDYYLESHRNATDAVIKAGYNVSKKHGKPDRMLARNIASENLAKPGIKNYIREKLETHELSIENVMRQHSFLINQFDDLSVKAKAIDMYYKKIGAYASDKNDEKKNDNLDSFMDRLANMFPD
ncbi:MAG: terminase small subunit [Candidatus Levybacteria bacterium]|nr:terminase small subunit [Candidatus Levybacteria bacterium]